MKQSSKKPPRGQMVYAPIGPNEQRSKSPFSSSKKMLIGSRSQQGIQQGEQQPIRSSIKRTQPPPSPQVIEPDRRTPTQSYPMYHDYEETLQTLQRQNSELRVREEIYVSKLLKLQEGLEKQHEEFMNLQLLYTELFQSYKQKQQEVSQLQLRYKETERERNEYQSKPNNTLSNANSVSMNAQIVEEAFKAELTQLIYQNKRLNETNEKLLAQLSYLKSKFSLNESRHSLEQKVIEEIGEWEKQLVQVKEDKIKLEYENRFLKVRNEDLEKTVEELEKMLSIKQQEIVKMREDKFATRKLSSEKILNRSPPKMDSARSKGSNQESKKFTKLIETLQKENHRLRQENFILKEKLKSSFLTNSTLKLGDSISSNHGHTNYLMERRKLEFNQSNDQKGDSTLRSYQDENFNSQNINEQYFSFSRQKQERASEEDLPTFPMDLQIQGIIKKHEQTKNSGGKNANQLESVQNQA